MDRSGVLTRKEEVAMSAFADLWFSLRSISPRQEVSSSQPGTRLACAFAALVFLIVSFAPSSSSAQEAGAIPQFSTIEAHEYDTINLGTLGIRLNVQIRSKAGHIPYSYRLTGASQITIFQGRGQLFQLSPLLVAGEAHVARTAGNTSTTECFNSNHQIQGYSMTGFYVTDALGNTHSFPGIFLATLGAACPGPQSEGAYAADNSGLYLFVNWNNGSPIYTLTDMDGNTQTASSTGGFPAMTDPNGNTISATTDTLGQTAMTTTGIGLNGQMPGTATFTWTDALSHNQTVTLTPQSPSPTLYTAFGCAADGSPIPNSTLPASISFPDTSSAGFTWEISPLNGSDYTGRIASITLPTGGTISYAYSGGTNGINCLDGTPATMTRTTPDGQWVYTHVASTTSPKTTVLAPPTTNFPNGTNTVYTFVMQHQGISAALQPLEAE
jgi:hypothetical protein